MGLHHWLDSSWWTDIGVGCCQADKRKGRLAVVIIGFVCYIFLYKCVPFFREMRDFGAHQL